MDSKYTISLNGNSSKGSFNPKRSKNASSQKKKKLKLTINKCAEVASSSHNEIKVSKPSKENKISLKLLLLEQRKKLPVYGVRRRLLEEIKKNKTMIIIGETGSGKTTQIPQMIHEARIEGNGMIAVTQPRRVAAITIAMRVSQEMNTPIGEIVGYNVRFEDMTSKHTKVKYMTDGMLLREAMLDPLLKAYSVIILDEAHERTVSTDVLFGIIKQAQKDRREKSIAPLKIIVMSATMNVDTFSAYFEKCPVIYLEGRTHPVTVYHMKTKSNDYQHMALCTVFQLHKESPVNHDILVFMTGQEEIESLAYNIRQISKEIDGNNLKVYPLYAGLPPAQQLEAWRPTPSTVRKVVLATNIAETSITIPNIKYVIDTGVVKSRRYCSTTGAEFLRVEPCSQAACLQRTGRAGRDSPGRCYRLYTAQHFGNLQPHTLPDILRCPLAPTVLQLLALNKDPITFDLIDKPPEEAMNGAMHLLKQLGAVSGTDFKPSLTLIGKKMAAFPIDPKFSKILLNAPEFGCLDEVLSVIALLSSEGIFHSPVSKREEAALTKRKFISPLGDHITLLNVYKGYCNAPLKKQWCKDNFINIRNIQHAEKIRKQLSDICVLQKIPSSSCGTANEQVIKCLVSGLFVNVAWVRNGANSSGGGRYMTASGMAAAIHPASVLHSLSPPPNCLLYTELISTQRTYINSISIIESDWLHQIVPEFARKCRILH